MTARRALLVEPAFCRTLDDPAAGPIPPGVHVIRGESAGGSLMSAGAKPLIVVPDHLAVGPSSRSLRQHRKIRERFWRSECALAGWTSGSDREDVREERDREPDRGDLLGADGVAVKVAKTRTSPTYLWCSGFWPDLLFLGWLLDATERNDLELGSPVIAGDLGQSMPLGWRNPNQFLPLGRDARALSPQLRRELVEVWQAFTHPTPDHLERLREAPPNALPTFVDGLAAYASMLPRRAPRARKLRLSAVDEVILRLIPSSRWVRFPDLFKGSSPSRSRWPRSGLFAMLAHFGQAFIQARIASWALGPGRALDQLDGPRSSDHPYPVSYRLTERGRALLAGGLDAPEVAPGVVIGGYRSGRGEAWCCLETPGGWRFARCF